MTGGRISTIHAIPLESVADHRPSVTRHCQPEQMLRDFATFAPMVVHRDAMGRGDYRSRGRASRPDPSLAARTHIEILANHFSGGALNDTENAVT